VQLDKSEMDVKVKMGKGKGEKGRVNEEV